MTPVSPVSPVSPVGAVSPVSAARLVRWTQLLIAAVVVASLVIQLVLTFQGGADANSGHAGTLAPLGTRLIRLFSFFTIESNIIVGAVAVLLVLRPARDGLLWRVARADSVLAIVITGLVYVFVLAPNLHPTGWTMVANIGFHYLTPVLAPLAWLLVGPRIEVTPRVAAAAFVWPVLWLIYTFVRGAATGWYPYPFLDAHKHGLAHALLNSCGVLVLGVVLMAVLLAVDRRVPLRR